MKRHTEHVLVVVAVLVVLAKYRIKHFRHVSEAMIALCLCPSVIRLSYDPIANGISTGGREPSDGYHSVDSNDLRGWDRISGETLPLSEDQEGESTYQGEQQNARKQYMDLTRMGYIDAYVTSKSQ